MEEYKPDSEVYEEALYAVMAANKAIRQNDLDIIKQYTSRFREHMDQIAHYEQEVSELNAEIDRYRGMLNLDDECCECQNMKDGCAGIIGTSVPGSGHDS